MPLLHQLPPDRPRAICSAVTRAGASGSARHGARGRGRADAEGVSSCRGDYRGEEQPDAHRMAAANALASSMVVAAGFEVFDPSAATLHASPNWFDEGHARRAEPLADLLTQMLVNQLCADDEGSPG